jgi:hypothetical protein
VLGSRVSVRSLYKKKIIVACPTDKGDAGRLTISTNKCSIVRMPLAGTRPDDGGTLTIVANKCSIVRNAPCRMNMHLPRRPDPCPLLLPRSELHRCRPPVLPRCSAHERSRVQGCRSSRNHSISLDPVGELSSFPLVPCPDCGMARVVERRTQNEAENHGRLYFKCARNSTSSLLCLKSELAFLCAFDSAVRHELWILSFPQGVSPDAEGCWRHCFSTFELGRHS